MRIMFLRFPAALLLFCSVASCDTKPLPSDGFGDVHGAWAYMRIFVEERLKSPQTADFPFGGFRHVKDLGSGRYEVNSYVDSENVFGAQIRTQFNGVILKDSGKWHLESLNIDG